MPIARFQMDDGRVARFEVPEGTTPEQAQTIMAQHFSVGADPAVSAGKSINQATGGIPRQLGLTARYGLEGLAEGAQLVTEPLRYLTDKLTPDRSQTVGGMLPGAVVQPKSTPLSAQATKLADWMGLPSPETPTERVVGNASRLVAGTMGNMGVGKLAQNGQPLLARLPEFAKDAQGMVPNAVENFTQAARKIPSQLGDFLTQAPTMQTAAAAGAGLAGGASKEGGGGTGAQVAASVLGGLAGGGLAATGSALANKATSLKNALMSDRQMDVKISSILERSGVDYSQMPERARQALRSELSGALRAEQELDPAAVARLADFRRNGLTPTRGTVSLDPVQITREQNLAKMGANSGDTVLQGLPRIQNQNNVQLINRLNEMGARADIDPVAAGRMLQGRVTGTQAGLRSAEQDAWTTAKASPGYTQPIYPEGLNAINKALGDEGMMGYMAKPISEYMAAFQTGQQPFTPQAYKNLQSMIAGEMAKGGNEAAAAGIARRALESSPMRPITNPGGRDFGSAPVTEQLASMLRASDAQAGESIQAVDAARRATRAAYQYEDSSPLVRSVLSGGSTADPTRIAQRFVIGGTPDEAAMVAREVGSEGVATIRDALITHIKREAMGGAADEVGKVSQSKLNSTIRKIGQEKLRMFFSPAEIEDLSSAARAASYMQVQPVGSAVNNSNSGALLLGRGLDVLNKTPFFGPMVAPALKNIDVSLQTRRAQNLMPGLLATQQKPSMLGGMLAPGMALGGLLSAPPMSN